MGRAREILNKAKPHALLALRAYLCVMGALDIVTDVAFWTEGNMLEMEEVCLDILCTNQLGIRDGEVDSAVQLVGLNFSNYSSLLRSGVGPQDSILVSPNAPIDISAAHDQLSRCMFELSSSGISALVRQSLSRRLPTLESAQQCVRVTRQGQTTTYSVVFDCPEDFSGVRVTDLLELLKGAPPDGRGSIVSHARACIQSAFPPNAFIDIPVGTLFRSTTAICPDQGGTVNCPRLGTLGGSLTLGKPSWAVGWWGAADSRCRAPVFDNPEATLPEDARAFFQHYFFWSKSPLDRGQPSAVQSLVCRFSDDDAVFFGRYHREIRVTLIVAMLVKEITKALLVSLAPWFASIRNPDRFKLVMSSPMLLPLLCSSYFRQLWRVAEQRPGIAGVVIDLVLEDLPQQLIQILVVLALKATVINILSLVASALLMIPTLIKVAKGVIRSSKQNAEQRAAELKSLELGHGRAAQHTDDLPEGVTSDLSVRLSEIEGLLQDVVRRVDALEGRDSLEPPAHGDTSTPAIVV